MPFIGSVWTAPMIKRKINSWIVSFFLKQVLREQRISHETHAQIRNLFDRRNKSPVSHADPIAWAVTKDEYMDYRSHVGNCLQHLFRRKQ